MTTYSLERCEKCGGNKVVVSGENEEHPETFYKELPKKCNC